MRTSIQVCALLFAGTLAALADTTYTSVVLSNESGGLIDKLVAAGYGDSTPYQVMQYLQPYSNGAISTAFMTQLASCLAGSEISTAKLSGFTSDASNPISINSDCTLMVVDITGHEYNGHTGYITASSTVGSSGTVNFTYANSSSYYIDTGATVGGGATGPTYQATAVIWAPASPSATPVPPSVLLMLTGLGGAAVFRLRRRFQSRG